jgi:hypothetical protein
MGEQQLGHIAAELYALPFDEFVAARTAAAKNAAAGTGRSLAAAVRALPKPSVAAWAVNILAAHRPDTVRQLSELGQLMRRAQDALDAGTLRSLSQERRQLLTSVMETVRAVAEQQGRRLSAAVAAEVERTLRAATVDERAAAAVRSGQLLRVLSADGVDLVDLHDAVAVPSVLAVPGTPTPPAPQAPPVPPVPPVSPVPPVPLAEKEGRPETEGRKRADQPRLKAVNAERPAPTPSAVERATARLAEAEQAARSAAEEAAKRGEELEEAAEDVAELGDEARRLRERLKTVDEELDQARKSRDAAAARMQLAARAAEKGRRAEVLARERVLRLRNTPD